MAFAALAGIGALLGGASAVAGTAMSANRQAPQNKYAGAQLQQANDNFYYQQLLNALATQRSVAGYNDSFGSSLKYDPGSNTWQSQLGKLPYGADLSSLIETIRKNTIDAGQQRFANERAATRASMAEPGADRAIRDFNTYQPVNERALTGLLTQQAATANADAYRNVLSDTLRTMGRGNTAAGPAVAAIGSKAAQDLRNSMVAARISGMQGVGELNRQRLGTLASTAATGSSLASPQFQATPGQASNRGDILANMQSNQSRTAAFAPIYGAGNINQALGQSNAATKNMIDTTPDPSFGAAKISEIGKQLSGLSDPKGQFMTGMQSLFGGGSDGGRIASGSTSALTGWTDPGWNMAKAFGW